MQIIVLRDVVIEAGNKEVVVWRGGRIGWYVVERKQASGRYCVRTVHGDVPGHILERPGRARDCHRT